MAGLDPNVVIEGDDDLERGLPNVGMIVEGDVFSSNENISKQTWEGGETEGEINQRDETHIKSSGFSTNSYSKEELVTVGSNTTLTHQQPETTYTILVVILCIILAIGLLIAAYKLYNRRRQQIQQITNTAPRRSSQAVQAVSYNYKCQTSK